MNLLVEKFTDMILSKYASFAPTVITYGSNCYGTNNSDLDICIVVHDDFDQIQDIIEDTIAFSIKNGIKIDDEIPYTNKLIYGYKEVENILMESIFIGEKGVYNISDIVKTKDFLNSKEMRSRLLINILTTEHRIMCGKKRFVELCEEKAWMIVIDALVNSYQLNKEVDEETFADLLYKNPHTGAEGEWYLGYKKNYPQKAIYLRKCIHKYLKIYKERRINLAENVNPYFPTVNMLSQITNLLNKATVYPENKDISLRKVIASIYGFDESNILVTSGAMDAIHVIIDKYVLGEAAIIQPSFWGYENSFKKLNKRYCNIEANVDNYTDVIRKACQKYNYVVVCNPNNPTLAEIEIEEIEKILYEYPECTLIIDETIMVFRDDYLKKTAINKVQKYNNLIVLMSLSKISGLSGLRCGYIAANPKIVELLISQRALYNTNSICQEFFCKNVEEIIQSDAVKARILKNFQEFIFMLDKSHISSIREENGSFILINFHDNINLDELEQELIFNNIYIQYLKKIYPQIEGNWVRVSAGTRADFILLANCLNEYMSKMENRG